MNREPKNNRIVRKFGGFEVELSNQDKVLFPRSGTTKGEVVDYYANVAKYMLPHTKGRYLVMQRYPDGIKGEIFYQKRVPAYFPKWLKRKSFKLSHHAGSESQVIAEKQADLAYLANQAVITMHLWLSLAQRPHYPDKIIWDLDPRTSDLTDVRLGARELKKMLEKMGLHPFLMSTGSKAFHVVVPIKPEYTFDKVRDFAKSVGAKLAEKYPDKFTLEFPIKKRKGRIFVDYVRNNFGQTGVAPYSVRAREGAPVATPLAWSELDSTHPQQYTVRNIFKRLAKKGDVWKGFFSKAKSIGKLIGM